MSGQVIAVASGKGGVGKTTAAVNLAVGIRMTDASVALVDADLGMPNLGSVLSITSDTTIHDYLADECTLDEIIVERAEGFAIIVGDRDLTGMVGVETERLADLLGVLADRYEYVIVDTSAGLSFEALFPVTIADEVILVTTGEPASVSDTKLTADVIRSNGGSITGVIIGQTDGSADASMIADRLDTELLGTISEDPAVRESTVEGKPLALHAPDSAPTSAYQNIAGQLVPGGSFTRSAGNVIAN